MPDEKPLPATLETLAQQIADFRQEMVGLHKEVATGLEQASASVKSELRVEIEAVREDVKRVYDTVVAQREMNERFLSAQERLGKRVDNHDLRITALERPDPRS